MNCTLPPLEDDIMKALQEKGAQDIVWLYVKDVFPLTSYFCIASVTSQRHLDTLANAVKDVCRRHDFLPPIQGKDLGETIWVVVDAGTSFVHLFTPEAREYYALEERWKTTIDTKTLHGGT